MKSRNLLFAILTALSVQASQNKLAAAELALLPPVRGITIQQSYTGMPRLDYSKMPRLDYSKLPWLKEFARSQAATAPTMVALMANLKTDIDSATSGLSALTDSLKNDQENAVAIGEATALAADYSTIMSQDLSTLLSQDLSVNYGQLLSTSLAVPTAPPTPPWVNRPGAVVVRTPSGEVVLPTYPPRTAWGNGGMVVTTPGGAVVSMVPGGSQTRSLADSEALRALGRQLQVVQSDVEHLESFLKNLNTSTNVPGSVLEPTILNVPKPANPPSDQESKSSATPPVH